MSKLQKAWFYNEYGSIDVLQFGEVPVPKPGPSQLLVKIRAAALNPTDFRRRNGLFGSEDSDFPVVPGRDQAGVVVEVGDGVSKFKNGDEVYSDVRNFEAGRGQSVFIVGGAGGVGSLAIQLARHVYGASRIVSTSSTGKLEFVKSLGADVVIVYTKQSYDQISEKFDFVFDTIGDSAKSQVVAKEEAKVLDIALIQPPPRVNFSGYHPTAKTS
eukprot:PITA_20108